MAVAPAGLSRPSSRSSRAGRDAVPRGSGRATPQLRVLGRPRHTRRYVVASLLMAAAGIFGIISLNALAAEAAFEARTLESEVTELSLRYDELTAEVASLSAPGRVRRVAREELGMVPAPAAGFLFAEAVPTGGRLLGSLNLSSPLDTTASESAAQDDTAKQALGER